MGGCFSAPDDDLQKKGLILDKGLDYGEEDAKLTLSFYSHRGEAEPIRLVLRFLDKDFEDTGAMGGGIDYEDMCRNAGSDRSPFGMVPMLQVGYQYVGGSGDLCLRYLGRRYDLKGRTIAEQSLVDMMLFGVEAMRQVYNDLVLHDQMAAGAKESYCAKHLLPASSDKPCEGAHMQYLNKLLARNVGSSFAVGASFTIADAQLFDIVDLHLRHAAFPAVMREKYPGLVAYYHGLAALPAIARYLGSSFRLSKVNANGLG